MRHLTVPSADGPWSWRSFPDRPAAYGFYRRVAPGDPAPRQLEEPHLAPDGKVLAAGVWVVIYHPIINGPHLNAANGTTRS